MTERDQYHFEQEKTKRLMTGAATIGALAFLLFCTSCSITERQLMTTKVEAETMRMTVCMENGGQWLRVPEVSAFECRHTPSN